MTTYKDSFEGKYSHDSICYPIGKTPYPVEYGNLFVPENWTMCYKHSTKFRPEWDEDNVLGILQPESRGVDPVYTYRVKDGETAFTWFAPGIMDAYMYTRKNAEIGETITASIYAHGWSQLEADGKGDTSTGVGKVGYDAVATAEEFGDSDGDNIIDWIKTTGDPDTDARINLTFWIGIDPTGGKDPDSENIIWCAPRHIYNKYAQLKVTTKAQAEKITIWIRGTSFWRFAHNDFYWDLMEYTRGEDVEEPEDPVEGYFGAPRVQYERTYVLLPQNAALKTAKAVLENYFTQKYTIGYSADDAGIGALNTKGVIVVWEDEASWVKEDIENFFETYYPGTTVTHFFVNSSSDDSEEDAEELSLTYPTTHLPAYITSKYGENRGTYIHYGLDLRSSYDAWKDIILCAYPGVVIDSTSDAAKGYGNTVVTQSTWQGKTILVRYAHLKDNGIFVKVGDAVVRGQEIGQPGNTGNSTGDHLHIDVRINGSYTDPEPLIVFPEEEEETEEVTNPPVNAISFHIQTLDKVEEAVKNYIKEVHPTVIKAFDVGVLKLAKELYPDIITVYRYYIDSEKQRELLNAQNAQGYVDMFYPTVKPYEAYVDYVESLNEVCAGDNVTAIVNFEIAFIKALTASGLAVKPVILTIPVGNPAESAYDDLIPAIKELVKVDGFLGYHSYYWVDANENGLESWWKWHAGRFTEMDKVFNAYGLYPKYMLGEIGAVGTTDKGYTLLPNSGWQNYMQIDQYISQLKTFKALIDKWNSANNNRCQGGTIFTLCTWDWKTFTMSAGDIDKLRTAL